MQSDGLTVELTALTDGRGFWAQNGSSWGQSNIVGSLWGEGANAL